MTYFAALCPHERLTERCRAPSTAAIRAEAASIGSELSAMQYHNRVRRQADARADSASVIKVPLGTAERMLPCTTSPSRSSYQAG